MYDLSPHNENKTPKTFGKVGTVEHIYSSICFLRLKMTHIKNSMHSTTTNIELRLLSLVVFYYILF